MISDAEAKAATIRRRQWREDAELHRGFTMISRFLLGSGPTRCRYYADYHFIEAGEGLNISSISPVASTGFEQRSLKL